MTSDGKGFLILCVLLIVLGVISFVWLPFGLSPREVGYPGVILVLLGGFFAWIGLYNRARARREAYIRVEGVDGKAKLVQWWILGKSGGELELIENIKFELEVMLAGKPPYKVNHRQLTSFGVYSQLSKGMILPVKVHPEKPRQLLLDWEQMGTQVQQVQVLNGADLPVNVAEMIKGLGVVGGKKDLKDKLSELEAAYKEGLITEGEYDSKRAEILKNL